MNSVQLEIMTDCVQIFCFKKIALKFNKKENLQILQRNLYRDDKF